MEFGLLGWGCFQGRGLLKRLEKGPGEFLMTTMSQFKKHGFIACS